MNTTTYHPQTDGLVEWFNRTLTSMLAKKVERSGRDWDVQLLFVLFAYRASLQETLKSPLSSCSTGEIPGCQQHCRLIMKNLEKRLILTRTKGRSQ